MKKRRCAGLMMLIFIFASVVGYAQTVSVDDTTNSPSDLVNVLLDNACVQVSNVAVSSEQSVAYFNNNGGAFPIQEGVVIRSGKAKLTEGAYTGADLGSQLNSLGDADLENINYSSGQSSVITDVAYMEFDFIPLSSNFNFNFLFASNEYGEWQCVSSDVFAFLLTDLSTGQTTNLAVIPGTTTPISVRDIKDDAYNSSCQSDNAQLFSSYQVTNPATSTLNMRGYTEVMNASAEIIPGNSYRIRLVIGDSNDADYDSAIFLAAGSFNANVDLGEDRMFCQGDESILSTGLNPSLYNHSWTLNGQIILGETGNSLVVSETGTYGVTVTQNSNNCLITDEVVVSDLQVETPVDLRACFTGFTNHKYDLTQNNEAALGIDNNTYDLVYYASNTALVTQSPIPASALTQYTSAGNQTIYVKLKNTTTGKTCAAVYSFNLLVNPPIAIDNPSPIEVCVTPPSDPVIDLTQVGSQAQYSITSESTYVYSYFGSLQDAQNDQNEIIEPQSYSVPWNSTNNRIWIRVEDPQFPGCYATAHADINLNMPPAVDTLPDVMECSEYVLPPLTNGNYFTKPNGAGKALSAGDIVEKGGTYYIYSGPDEKGCTSESSFYVVLVKRYGVEETHCGSFKVPTPPTGGFYTAPGGPEGSGNRIWPGTRLTTNQTIYFYAKVNGEFCVDKSFDITILPLPPIDKPTDVVTCNSYTLPALANGNYYTKSNGGGSLMNAGDVITSSKTLYVFNDDGVCTNQHKFKVTIIPDFEDVVACGSYELPNVEVGGFYTEASGQGQQIAEGATITSSQNIYYYAETTTVPNCTENLSFNVTIKPIPPVDELDDILLCEGEFYVLPTLTHGQYFTKAGRKGKQLSAGETITKSTTIYINNLENGCDNETEFSIEIRSLPEIENFTDIYSCEPYELPVLRHGTYYTGPGGTGEILNGGDYISTTQTIYMYNDWDDLTYCYSEDSFTVYVEGIVLEDMADVSACDAYSLPALSVGDYYTESGAKGTKLNAGSIIRESQRVYVYAKNGSRFICESEKSFMVTISNTPDLEELKDVESCGSYTLPTSLSNDFNISYYWDAAHENKISSEDYHISTPGDYPIYVRAESKDNPDCTNETEFLLTVYPLRDLYLEDATICRDPETGEVESPAFLFSGLDPAEFTVNWYYKGNLVHTGPDYDAVEAGEYTVKTTKLTPDNGSSCNYNPGKVIVDESSKPLVRAKVTEPFEDVAVITVEVVKGFGDYEYQLGDGEFQSSNVFDDVPSGTNVIKVRGTRGYCGETVLTVEVLKFPKFFTPNNDGYNDTWNIPDLAKNREAKIHIFDRYGKLITTISPRSAGWDGQLHSKSMPSNDYWFKVEFTENGVSKEFKSHFTLKR